MEQQSDPMLDNQVSSPETLSAFVHLYIESFVLNFMNEDRPSLASDPAQSNATRATDAADALSADKFDNCLTVTKKDDAPDIEMTWFAALRSTREAELFPATTGSCIDRNGEILIWELSPPTPPMFGIKDENLKEVDSESSTSLVPYCNVESDAIPVHAIPHLLKDDNIRKAFRSPLVSQAEDLHLYYVLVPEMDPSVPYPGRSYDNVSL